MMGETQGVNFDGSFLYAQTEIYGTVKLFSKV